jgi:O-antigen ligase
MDSVIRQASWSRKAILQSAAATIATISGAIWAGAWIGSRSTSEPLLILLALGVLGAIARSPRLWLMLVVALTAVRNYDNVLAGGFLSWSKLLTMAMLVLYSARIIIGRARLHVFRDWLLPLMLILGWAVASLLWAYDRALALQTVVSWVSLIMLQGLIYAIFKDDFRAVEMAIYAYLVTMTAIALVGLYTLALAPGSSFARTVMGSAPYSGPFGGTVGRFFGFYSDSNSVAMMLNYAIFFVLAPATAGQSGEAPSRARWFLLGPAGLLVLALVSTYSRSGLGAFLVGMAYLVYSAKGRSHILFYVAAVGGIAYLLREGMVARLGQLQSTGWGTRLPELKLGLMEFVNAPITGIGLESFRPRLRAMGISVFQGQTPVIHNTYLKFLVELGLPGFLLLLWFCAVLFRRYRRNSQLAAEAVSSRLRWINIGFGACFVGTSVFALFLGVAGFNPLWMLIGLFAVTSVTIERTYHESTSCTR